MGSDRLEDRSLPIGEERESERAREGEREMREEASRWVGRFIGSDRLEDRSLPVGEMIDDL